jgi:hypothetical protein
MPHKLDKLICLSDRINIHLLKAIAISVSRKALGDRFNYVTARGFADNLRTRK